MRNEEKTGPRVVLDSNVWVSALITPQGKIARLTRAVIRRNLPGIVSDYILDEIEVTLAKKFFRQNYAIGVEDASRYRRIISANLEIVTPSVVQLSVRDIEDLPILGTALAGRADYLVTGDRDLLDDQELVKWMKRRGVRVVSPAEFADMVKVTEETGIF